MVQIFNRRRAATVIASGLALGGCAATSRAGTPILVNLADPAPADTAQLVAASDIADRLTAPVMINEQGPYNFVVDTGANRTVVSTELAQALALPSAGRAQIHGIAGVEPAPTAFVARLDIGRVTSRRLRAPTLSRERLGADGLMGVDVLKNRRVTMDFRRNSLSISKADDDRIETVQNVSDSRLRGAQAGAVGNNVVVVQARYRFGQLIIIDADMGGVPVTAFLDSGSQNTVGNLKLHEQLAGASRAFRPQISVVELISATGQRARGELTPVPPLRMGGLSVGNLTAVFADLHIFKLWELNDRPAILVGIDVMRHFEAIELDFGHRQVRFHTPPRAARRPN